jgi:hypothetical protein
MQNKVSVIPDESGNVIRVSKNNPEYGHVRLQQSKLIVGSNGWVKSNVVTTLLHGTVDDLQEMGIHNMKELPGKIVIQERFEPFSEKEPERDLKRAGDTGIICCSNGQPIYRKTLYVPNMNAEDELIAHDNGDAIRKANAGGIENIIKHIDNVKTPKVNKSTLENNEVDNSEIEIEIEDEVLSDINFEL